MQRAAAEWKEWVKLCIIARLLSVPGIYNFSVPSKVHAGPYEPLDSALLAKLSAQLENASGLSTPQFKRRADRVSALVERIYALGQHDRLFKGSWYGGFLSVDLARAARGRAYNANGIKDRFVAAALAKLDFTQQWADDIRTSVSLVVRALQELV
jgi:hypothetical protein